MKRLCVIFTCLGLAACQFTSSESPHTLRLQIASDPVSLDPALAEDGSALRLLANTMDGLVGYDDAGKLELRLAQSYQVSEGGRHWTFTLKTGIQWSDGKSVTAEDFVTGLRRSLDPKTGSKLADVFSMIRDPEKSVRAESGKLVIDLARPAPYLLQALSMSQAMPEREDILKANSGKWPIHAPVTGAYKLVSYKPAGEMEFERNPSYWRVLGGAQLAFFDHVKVFIVADDGTARNLFEQKRVDVLGHISAYDIEKFRAKGWLLTSPFLATYYVSFNASMKPFSDRNARCAVSQAIDREALVRALRTGERYGESWVPMGLEGSFEHAPKEWKTAAAKFSNWPSSVEAGFDSSTRNSQVMEKVQSDLKQKLGLQLSLQNMDWKTYIRGLATKAPPLFRFAWMAPFGDPIVPLLVFVSTNPNNYSKWKNARYDSLIDEIASMESSAERTAKIVEAQKILLNDECILVPLYHYVQLQAVRPELKGFQVNPFGIVQWREMSR